MPTRVLLLPAVLLLLATAVLAANPINEPTPPGVRPVAEDGRALNLDFETGDLTDWTAEGDAWEGQPIRGEIDQNREFGEGKRAQHTGEYWLGGYEKLKDPPRGTLTSAAFQVTHPWGSFLIGGGAQTDTRVELRQVEEDGRSRTFFRVSGVNEEEMRPVVVDLSSRIGKMIQIRIVDQNSGGWGHVNFDDFRFHAQRPKFELAEIKPAALVSVTEVYPHAGLDPHEAAAAMRVPSGFEVQLAAAEPDVQQPVAMCIDDRGRLWIAEAFTYPTRAPEGEGKDRILIFEDTNQDGVLDKRTVFIEGLNLVTGLEVGFGGVWVGAAPYLMFIPDRNGDDIPDGMEGTALEQRPRADVPAGATVLLDGWHYEDTHETLNAFIWGPDGWLYGCHGVFTHSRVGKPGTPNRQRIPLNAAIWRYHPTKHEFEVFAEGTSNPWGVDFNDWGQAFATACVIPHLYHIIPGARYQRQAGQHFNPHTYDDIQTIARHRHYVGNQWNANDQKRSDDLGGGHAHAGAMVYLGGSWPAEYRNKLFMHNIHGNRVNVDVLIPEGSGYAGDRNPDFLLTGDKWSQMINMRYGPDGQMWTIDWYDANQCHRVEEQVHDRSNGRVFRVSYNQTRPVQVNLATASDIELARQIDNPNDWYVRHARRLLQERAAAGAASDEALKYLTGRIAQPGDETRRLRALWAVHVMTDGSWADDAAQVLRLLSDESEWVRGWALQLAGERLAGGSAPDAVAARLIEMSTADASPVVRLHLAALCQKLPAAQRWDVLAGLTSHAEDDADHNLPLMYWYALEPLADVDPQRALALAVSASDRIPRLQDYMVRRMGSGDPQQMLELLAAGLEAAKEDRSRLTFLRGINGALRGRRELPQSSTLAGLADKYASEPDALLRVEAQAVSMRFGNERATAALRETLQDGKSALDARRAALRFLLETRDARLVDALPALLSEPALRRDAIRAAAVINDDAAADRIVAAYATLTPEERRDALGTLASRASYGQRLLAAVQSNAVPRGDLSAELVRQLRNLNDDSLTSQLEQVWGVVRETAADRAELLTRYTALLESESGPPQDRELGRALFAKTCQQCHTLFGTGGKVGPDLTGSNRANTEYLLSNIVDPSSVMAKEYRPTVFALADGRVLTGLVKDDTGANLTVQTANELVTFPKEDVEDSRESDQSMMPDDLLKNLSDAEIRALAAYLQGAGQTPILATRENITGFFNGQDLTNWFSTTEQAHGGEAGSASALPPMWTVEDGELVGRTTGLRHNEFLVSEYSLADFRFRCEVKLVNNEGNSGIQFRSVPAGNAEVRGYQADIGAGWWGKLYEELGRGLLEDNDAEKHVKRGDWNTYEIVAVGSRVRTWINGQLCLDRDDPAAARAGVIALQLHSGGPTEIRFRSFEIDLLEPNPASDRVQPGAGQSEYPSSRAALGAALGVELAAAEPASRARGEIRFQKTVLDDKFRGEGACIADFDNDGDMDIAAGSLWFEQTRDASGAIVWKTHSLLEKPNEFDVAVYSDSFMNWAEDLNGDGRLDLIVVDFPGKQTWWFENPGETGAPWRRHEITPVTNNESPQYLDLTGDGRRNLLLGYEGGTMGFATPKSHPGAPWALSPVSGPGAPGTDRFSHGLGVGDLNGDGRSDLLITDGWWEQPSDPNDSPWTFHPAPFGPACSQMYVFDFDGDGDNDVLTASAHDYGIWWHENVAAPGADPQWKTHEIDRSFSETHAVVLADINNDGLPDFVTGKRWYSHGGHGPGGMEPAVLHWFELQRESVSETAEDGTTTVRTRPKWVRHEIDVDSGVGTQFDVADINGDGLLDIAISNKKGTFVFLQTRE
ncbi:MAG: DUF1080 domain-containing protein [Planctomyces sp.]|nr:DUF1080 domain-containing protein [Planctomyces sp.]